MAQLAGTSMVEEPTVRHLSAPLGAEVTDLDLSRRLDAATIARQLVERVSQAVLAAS
jgi:hypothetical protein